MVGLLYLMRVGMIVYGDIEIIPKITELTRVLPAENNIKLICKLSTKIMTEAENMIKLETRNIKRSRLLNMGFEVV